MKITINAALIKIINKKIICILVKKRKRNNHVEKFQKSDLY